jgi:RNA polymerase sigma-70 factor (ECF subfamily)
MCEQNETQVIRKAQAGDAQAFSVLVENHQLFLYNLALRVTSHPQEAQDLAQEAFIRAWRGLSAFRGQSSFRTWLYRILVNLSYDRYPKLKREMNQLSIDAEEIEPPQESFLEEQVDQKELRTFLHQQMKELPESYRLVLLLRYQKELSYKEIAAILDIPMGTVKTIIFRAKAELRTRLAQQQEVVVWME